MGMTQSHPFTFDYCYSNTTRPLVKPVMLAIVIVSRMHVHKKVVKTESSTGACIKGADVLPNWVIATGTKHDGPAVGSVQDMIRDWEDGYNSMFLFKPGSKEEAAFKNSKRSACVKNLPKFSILASSRLANTLSLSPFVLTPINQPLGALLKQVLSGVMKCVDTNLIQFIKNYKQDSNLLGHNLWDKLFRNQMSVELQLYYPKRNAIFKQTKLIEGCNTNFARCSDWDLATYIETKRPYSRKNLNIRKISDHLSAKPAANSNPALNVMRKSSSKSSGYSKIRSEASSNLCCA